MSGLTWEVRTHPMSDEQPLRGGLHASTQVTCRSCEWSKITGCKSTGTGRSIILLPIPHHPIPALPPYVCPRDKFGWPPSKVDELLSPVLKAYEQRQSQLTMDQFLSFNQASGSGQRLREEEQPQTGYGVSYDPFQRGRSMEGSTHMEGCPTLKHGRVDPRPPDHRP